MGGMEPLSIIYTVIKINLGMEIPPWPIDKEKKLTLDAISNVHSE